MPDNEIQTQIKGIFDLWNEAEERIKQAERIRAEIVIPSIKELRYGGRWLADVIGILYPIIEDKLSDRQRSDLSKALFEASQNCIRAKNDAVDAAVLFAHRRLKQMVDEFGIDIVYTYFPDYVKLIDNIREIDVIIAESRGTQRPNRNEFYDDIAKTHLPKLIDIYRIMISAEDAIQALMLKTKNDQETKESKERSSRVINYFLAIGGIIIGIVGIVVGVIVSLH